MSQSASRRAVAVVVVSLTALTCVTDLRAESRITIRVYGESTWNDAGTVLPDAIRTAATIVGETGLDARWIDCRGPAADSQCAAERGPRDVVVRLIPKFAALAAGNAEAAQAGDDDATLVLGKAVINRTTHFGTLATIFLDHVRVVANRVGIEQSSLLGRVIAHEVGHLVQGRSGHSRTGLMRQVWTGREIRLNRHDDFLFDLSE